MGDVEEIIFKENALCKGCNCKLFVGWEGMRYSGEIKSLLGDYCSNKCLEREAESFKERIYAISGEDLPESM